MILRKGNFMDHLSEYDLVLFTANSIIKTNGRLVMGAGIAKDFRDTFKDLDKYLGQRIKHKSEFNLYVEWEEMYKNPMIGAFQTKINYKSPSNLELISRSVDKLIDYAKHRPNFKIGLTFPGIHHGKMRREDVMPILINLPNNVEIWEYS